MEDGAQFGVEVIDEKDREIRVGNVQTVFTLFIQYFYRYALSNTTGRRNALTEHILFKLLI